MFKFLGALVGAVLLVVAINFAGDFVFQANVPEQVANMRGEPLPNTPNITTADVSGGVNPDMVLVDTARGPMATTGDGGVQMVGLVGDPVAGKAVSRKCAACHSFEQGGPHKVGPNLWNVAGASVAHVDGFAYSPALAAAEGEWTIDNLREWLASPNAFIPGNKMTFAGIKNENDLNNLIAYIQTMQPAEEIGTTAGAPEPMEVESAAATEPAPAAAPVETAALGGDPAAGKKLSRACAACHSFDQGGPNKVGPNLFGIMGADIAHTEDFNYSPALQEAEGEWTVAAMDQWLTSPNTFISGNKMSYAGMKKEQDRQDLIAYLQSLQ